MALFITVDVNDYMFAPREGSLITSASVAATYIAKFLDKGLTLAAFTKPMALFKFSRETSPVEILAGMQDLRAKAAPIVAPLPINLALERQWGIDRFIVFTAEPLDVGWDEAFAEIERYRQISGVDAEFMGVRIRENGFTVLTEETITAQDEGYFNETIEEFVKLPGGPATLTAQNLPPNQ